MGSDIILRIKKISLVSFVLFNASLILLLAMILNIYQQNTDIAYYLMMATMHIYSIGVGILIVIDHICIRYKQRKK